MDGWMNRWMDACMQACMYVSCMSNQPTDHTSILASGLQIYARYKMIKD